jgi:hypothetical protein
VNRASAFTFLTVTIHIGNLLIPLSVAILSHHFPLFAVQGGAPYRRGVFRRWFRRSPEPRGGCGARTYYGLSGPASDKHKLRLAAEPGTGADLPCSVFTRRKRERFDFDGEGGNTVCFCLRRENGKGAAGPCGPMLKAVIP